MTSVVFDVDGTLITFEDQPKYEVIQILINFHKLGYNIDVHSGGGKEYAEMWVRRLELVNYVKTIDCKCRIDKNYIPKWDIAFDDEDVKYGKINLKV